MFTDFNTAQGWRELVNDMKCNCPVNELNLYHTSYPFDLRISISTQLPKWRDVSKYLRYVFTSVVFMAHLNFSLTEFAEISIKILLPPANIVAGRYCFTQVFLSRGRPPSEDRRSTGGRYYWNAYLCF